MYISHPLGSLVCQTNICLLTGEVIILSLNSILSKEVIIVSFRIWFIAHSGIFIGYLKKCLNALAEVEQYMDNLGTCVFSFTAPT